MEITKICRKRQKKENFSYQNGRTKPKAMAVSYPKCPTVQGELPYKKNGVLVGNFKRTP